MEQRQKEIVRPRDELELDLGQCGKPQPFPAWYANRE